ncbi:branched-chain amino acid transport system ATP-binding protein [Hydrogenoanaerobacterium saccharovorans]|uniref:Branched-chain amino acid transport system ATP-binding protein n=1 Tax=Hydrogenoanaerobacterium saccharovorans TaxID=474960 RepID=A0A1H8B695_9FIRM|nr:ABC transporter ATP-binding protein [Hydrogenoanaerobacterium saccharovorans]RPF47563.1 branched-chain amino acid transport system ATP-binding protein [Hydrogenoanaerobacterium saccharovorans]SEM78475.1 branched-chain amino acid transport system ATP-binding protein [Hydrogenoanaerobacterium saccharovorans]
MSALLEAKGVCKYFGGLKAVEGVDMSINKGDIFGIIGPNGAGKTTFFNICSGIYQPTKGEIWLDGEKISSLHSEQIARKGMARTFQNIQLFKYMSVLENVKIGFHIHTKTNMFDSILHTKTYKQDEEFAVQKGLEILEKVGLAEYRDTMAGNLAYGIQRKVEIARALALDPKILLLDEPAAGMNPLETQELMHFIKQLNQDGYTIAVIEHDMKFVMNSCNRILVLNFGQKISEGTPDEIKADQHVHEAYFGKGIIAGEAVKANA